MDSDQPSSICHVSASELYPLPVTTDDAEEPTPPFAPLCGEAFHLIDRSADGLLALTNYRLYIQRGAAQHHIPLGLIEVIEVREIFNLHIGCKDARSFRCTFDNNEQCTEWFRRLLHATTPPRQLEDLFAFCFYAWTAEKGTDESKQRLGNGGNTENYFKSEVDRLQFDLHGAWRISQANVDYQLSPSYPPYLLVPACITDVTLEAVARFRSSRRIPAVVWRHPGNGAIIARSSQPEVGLWGWRSADDEDLLKAIADACAFDRGPKSMLEGHSLPHTPTSIQNGEDEVKEISIDSGKKVLIMDARSYTTAVANRARGGGCECPEYYPSCDIQFMNLANIHSIRKSFHALRQLCASAADQLNWYSLLEGTRWLQHMSGLMRAATTLAAAVERDARPVLVHCSDGWDRTSQIVALAELLLDPYYRTVEGFQVLVEREWLGFGHKFADRCGQAAGSEDQNERCPVFLQWLDCVHQLVEQFSCYFQFSQTFLVKLAQHTYSNLFGTFLCNTHQERSERVADKTFSVWRFLNAPCFKNHLYAPPTLRNGAQALWPACNVRDLRFWTEVYLGSLEANGELGPETANGVGETNVGSPPMTKTRSYGDLMGAAEQSVNELRRSSDPSITIDSMKLSNLTLSTAEEPKDAAVLKPELPFQNGLPIKPVDIFSELCNGSDSEPPEKEVVSNGFLKQVNQIEQRNGEVKELSKDVMDSINRYMDSNDASDSDNDEIHPTVYFKNQPVMAKLPELFKSDINHNGEVKRDTCDDDSDNDNTEPSDGKSEVTLCASPLVREVTVVKSVDTSTDTLVAESGVCESKDADIGEKTGPGFSAGNGDTVSDVCKVCAQNRKFLDKHSHQHSRSTSGKTSRYSTPPLYSRTPSGGWATTPSIQRRVSQPNSGRLDADGLMPLKSDLQHRVWQMVEEHKMKEDALQRELHTTRMALIQQVCHNCSHSDADKIDETRYSGSSSQGSTSHTGSPRRGASPCYNRLGSLVESVCSTGEGQVSAGESAPSDISWEALDDINGPLYYDHVPTLWVPDHAVSRCTGCHTEFWLGRRKHHCRNCGKIFCADCSENTTPLPSEQLFNPVRVCTSCYRQLRRECGEIQEKCKDAKPPAVNASTQVASGGN